MKEELTNDQKFIITGIIDFIDQTNEGKPLNEINLEIKWLMQKYGLKKIDVNKVE